MMFDLQDATGLEHDMTRLKVQAGSNGGVFEAISILRYLGHETKRHFPHCGNGMKLNQPI